MVAYGAFSDLSTCRQNSMGGVGAIPWTAFKLWCEDKDIRKRATREHLWNVVHTTDALWLSKVNKRDGDPH